MTNQTLPVAALFQQDREVMMRVGVIGIGTLGSLAAEIAPQTDTIAAASRDTTAAKRLFEAVDAALPDDDQSALDAAAGN